MSARLEWSEAQDEHGNMYYVNNATGVSQWEQPVGWTDEPEMTANPALMAPAIPARPGPAIPARPGVVQAPYNPAEQKQEPHLDQQQQQQQHTQDHMNKAGGGQAGAGASGGSANDGGGEGVGYTHGWDPESLGVDYVKMSFGCMFFSAFLIMLAVCTPYWVQRGEESWQGLWTVCFKNARKEVTCNKLEGTPGINGIRSFAIFAILSSLPATLAHWIFTWKIPFFGYGDRIEAKHVLIAPIVSGFCGMVAMAVHLDTFDRNGWSYYAFTLGWVLSACSSLIHWSSLQS